jgi:hypothetical protein
MSLLPSDKKRKYLKQINIAHCNPESINWNNEPSETIAGADGQAVMKTRIMAEIKVRKVAYSANYMPDHWCEKGHVVHVLSGELEIIHKDGSVHFLTSGMTYLVGDHSQQPHQARS